MNHLLIDGHNLLFRCGHTTGHLTLADGTPCGAAWGFLRSLLLTYRAELGGCGGKVHVCWDGGRSPRRMKLLPTYKSGRVPEGELTQAQEERQAEREAILDQMQLLQRLLGQLGVYQYKARGVEADDIIAALSTTLAERGSTVSVLSGDSDFLQLVRPGIILVNPSGKRYFPEDIPYPQETALVKCLAGCKSDAIPGYPGVGDKTAQQGLEWIRSTLPQKRGLFLPDIGLESIKKALQVSEARGRVKTLKTALFANPDLADRNYRLVAFDVSLQWPEVWQAAASPAWQAINPDAYQAELRAMAWHSMEELQAEARAVMARGKV